MKRILQIVPSISKASGVMSFVMNLYRNIDHNQYQFDIMYIIETPTTYKDEIESLGGNVIYIPKPGVLTVHKFYNTINRYLSEHRGEYVAIHLHEVLVGPIVLPLAKKYGIKTRIIHSHNSMPSEKPIRAFRNNLLCLPLKSLSNVWLACSEKAGLFLYGRKDLENVKIVNNGIDLHNYTYNSSIRKEVRKTLNIGEDTLVIGHVGRFCEQKNQPYLINIMDNLIRKIPNCVLLLIGAGENEGVLKKMVKNKSLNSKVKILGLRSDINHLLQGMDVFVLPSLFEGLPIAGIEAQAAGLPCVFSDAITKESDVTGNVSFLSLEKPYEEWVNNIIMMYETIQRRDTSEEMKNAGFDIVELVNRMEKIYNNK